MFRIAAGPRIGFGHLMRARTLARALGVRPVLSIRGGAPAIAAAREAGCTVLDGRRDSLTDTDVLIVDDPSEDMARRWVARARARGLLTVSVHDRGRGHAQADLVVDATAPRTALPARGALLGSRYYLLDPRLPAPPALRRHATRVLIALGGGAHVRRFARPLVEAIAARCPSVRIEVAAGLVAGRQPRLPHARWIVRRRGLSRTLAAVDVAVVAGGVTLFEACALGRPTVGMAVVPPQRTAIRAMASAGAVIDGGGPAAGAAAARRVGAAVAALVRDHRRRTSLGRRAAVVVDGQGARRVADAILSLVRTRGGRG